MCFVNILYEIFCMLLAFSTMGQGEGHGEDTATNVAAGSGVAICFTVCFFIIGIPAIITGAALLAIFESG